MVPSFSSAWLELAMAGLATAVLSNGRLSSMQGPALVSAALGAGARAAGRVAVLQATCAASDSPWARLVRAGLHEPTSEMPGADARASAGYRDAPQRTTSEPVTALFDAERARIRRRRAIGLGGTAAALLGSAMLVAAEPVLFTLLILAALATGWRLIANGRGAAAALQSARDALPELVATLPPPPPPVKLAAEPAPARVAVRSAGGALGGLLIVGCALIVLALGAGLVPEMLHRVPAKMIGTLFGVHVLLAPILIVLRALSPSVHATIDLAQGELVVIDTIAGIPASRTVVPLEIVGAFLVDSEAGGRGRTYYLAVEIAAPSARRRRHRPTVEQRVLLSTGEHIEKAAAALNRALGREGWPKDR